MLGRGNRVLLGRGNRESLKDPLIHKPNKPRRSHSVSALTQPRALLPGKEEVWLLPYSGPGAKSGGRRQMPPSVQRFVLCTWKQKPNKNYSFTCNAYLKTQSFQWLVKLSFEHFLLCQQKFKIKTQIKLPSVPGGKVSWI